MKQNICQGLKITIHRRFNARSLRLRLNRRGEVILTIPLFYPKQSALSFLEEHQDWIEKQKSLQHHSLCFQDGQVITLLGNSLRIHHISDAHFATHVKDGCLLVCGDSDFLNRRVTDFIRKETAAYIDQKARELATRINQKINRISLKDTISRWGSCSGRKNLNFCWRLGLAPLFVLDYIIAHEVAHLIEMNHGPRFWRLVSQLTEHRSQAEIWLRRYGSSLR